MIRQEWCCVSVSSQIMMSLQSVYSFLLISFFHSIQRSMFVVVWDYISCVCFVNSLCKGTHIIQMQKIQKKKQESLREWAII